MCALYSKKYGTLKVLQSSQVEFLRAKGYDQLGDDEKEVLAGRWC